MKREWFVVVLIVLVLVFVILLSPDSFVNLSPDGRSIFSQRGSSAVGVGECVDSDGGIDYNVRGRTQGTNGNFADSCSGSELTEYFCSPTGSVRSRNYDCFIDGGGSCVLGECVGGGPEEFCGDGFCGEDEYQLNCAEDCAFQDFVEVSKIIHSDFASSDKFGTSVSISGLTAIAGAPYHDHGPETDVGAAYVMDYNPISGEWVEEQELLALDRDFDDRFGHSVAIDGNTAVIGAYQDDDLGSNSGSAYVFRKDATGVWGEEQKLLGSNIDSGDNFGRIVDISGDIIVVGAYAYYDGASLFGEVIVFRYSAGSGQWVEEQIIKAADIPPSGAAANFFGSSVAVDGNVLVVGNYLGGGTGNAHVFRYNGASWVYEQTLTASDAGSGDLFGWDVDVDGDMIIAGAHLHDDFDLGLQSGAAYIFHYKPNLPIGERWIEREIFLPDQIQNPVSTQFGESVAINDWTVAIGTPRFDGGPDQLINTGGVFVYKYNGISWDFVGLFEASDVWQQDYFGQDVGISGNHFISGSPEDEETLQNHGAVYFFESSSNCGNGLCEVGEDGASCAEDCYVASGCGNYLCEIDENENNCAEDCVNRVFVTSQKWNGELGGTDGADLKCLDAAHDANLGGFWLSWTGTETSVGPEDRFYYSETPYELLNGVRIADNWNDLIDSNIQNPINLYETELPAELQYVWTGASPNGNGGFSCLQWTSQNPLDIGRVGRNDRIDNGWTSYTQLSCDVPYSLYCFEQKQTE
jgi:hypothetical protein